MNIIVKIAKNNENKLGVANYKVTIGQHSKHSKRRTKL